MPAMHLGPTDLAVMDALLPARAHPVLESGIVDTGFQEFIDDFARTAPPHLWRAFRIGLFAAAWVAPLLIRRLPSIARLGAADRESALAAMAGSNVPELRQLISVVKTVAALHYGALPSVRKAIGYP
jgi:fumarate reductase subunit D